MMNRNFLIRYVFPISVVLSLILAACATPTPEVVIETVTVKEIVVETVVVVEEKEVEVEKLVTPTAGPPPEVVYLRFYFPVGVAGSLAPKMEAMVGKFNEEHSNIEVEPIFAGGYVQTFQKALTANAAGSPPDVALVSDPDVWSLADAKAIMPLDDQIAAEGGEEYLADFHETFITDVTFRDHYWGMPFQKSTPIFYWNKEMFEEAGLDPEKPPETWDELLDYAQKLTVKDDAGNVVCYGVEIPIDTWLLAAFAYQNGMTTIGDGTEVYIDTPEMVGALEFMSSLANEYGVMPQKRLFGDSSADFVAGQTAMLYNSTGSLTFLRESADFEFGAAFHPGNVQRGVPTGGGPLVIFDNIPEENKEAAWEFVKWMTSPEIGAQWMLDTGYIAVRKSAAEVEELAQYVIDYPQALVAIEQLQYAYPQPPRTHDGRKIFQIITTALENAMFQRGEPADLLKAAQEEADKVLAEFK
jgi:sn-glycerol 3-phosphate transport system substrate-binding protein